MRDTYDVWHYRSVSLSHIMKEFGTVSIFQAYFCQKVYCCQRQSSWWSHLHTRRVFLLELFGEKRKTHSEPLVVRLMHIFAFFVYIRLLFLSHPHTFYSFSIAVVSLPLSLLLSPSSIVWSYLCVCVCVCVCVCMYVSASVCTWVCVCLFGHQSQHTQEVSVRLHWIAWEG